MVTGFTAHARTSRARNASARLTPARFVKRTNSRRSSSVTTNTALGRPIVAMSPTDMPRGFCKTIRFQGTRESPIAMQPCYRFQASLDDYTGRSVVLGCSSFSRLRPRQRGESYSRGIPHPLSRVANLSLHVVEAKHCDVGSAAEIAHPVNFTSHSSPFGHNRPDTGCLIGDAVGKEVTPNPGHSTPRTIFASSSKTGDAVRSDHDLERRVA